MIPCHELSCITVILYLTYEMLKATTVFHVVSFYLLFFRQSLLNSSLAVFHVQKYQNYCSFAFEMQR